MGHCEVVLVLTTVIEVIENVNSVLFCWETPGDTTELGFGVSFSM